VCSQLQLQLLESNYAQRAHSTWIVTGVAIPKKLSDNYCKRCFIQERGKLGTKHEVSFASVKSGLQRSSKHDYKRRTFVTRAKRHAASCWKLQSGTRFQATDES
jgi:hypothetical protein